MSRNETKLWVHDGSARTSRQRRCGQQVAEVTKCSCRCDLVRRQAGQNALAVIGSRAMGSLGAETGSWAQEVAVEVLRDPSDIQL